MSKIIKLWFQVLVFSYLFLFLAVFYFSNPEASLFHLDEYLFLKKSYFFDLLLKKDFSHPGWQEENFDQPRLGTYIYGLALRFKGIKDIQEWQKENKFNTIKVKGVVWWEKLFGEKFNDFPSELKPAVDLIIYSRRVAAFFGFGSLILLFFLGWLNKDLGLAFFSASVLGVNRLMLYYGRVAMTDAFQLFFFFLNLILLCFYLKFFFQKKIKLLFLCYFLLGLSAALATGVKVIGILSLIYSLMVFTVLFFINRRIKSLPAKKLFLGACSTFATFYFLFVLINPQIYSQPIKGFIQMFTVRWQSSVECQGQSGRPVKNKLEGLSLMVEKLFLPGNRFGNFGFVPMIPLDLLLFSGGAIILFKKAKQRLKAKNKLSLEFILLSWFALCFSSLFFYLKNDWPRYYLPLTAALTLIQAYCLAWLAEKLLKPKGAVIFRHCFFGED